MKRFIFPLALFLVPSLAFANDKAVTLTTTPAVVVQAGYHTLISVDNESAVSIACSFIGVPAVNTAGSWTIPAGNTRVWSSRVALPRTALQCVAASATAAVTVEND